MRLLLDTHIFLWSLLEPERLSRRVAEALRLAENEKWLSPVSVWECLVLAERGRVVLMPDARSWLGKALRDIPFREAPMTHEVAIQSRFVDVSHQDPADRFLAATAAVCGLTLVTADDRLIRGRGFDVLPNQ